MRVAECGPAQRGAKWQLRNKNIIYNTIFFAFVVLKWRHRFWMRLERQRQLFILIFGCNNFVCKILQNTESIFLLRKFQLLLKRQISGRRLSKSSERKKMLCVCGARENQRLQRFSFLNTVWFLLFIYIWFASVCNFHSVHQSMLLVMKRMMMLKFITQSKNDLIRLLISFELKRANK